MGKWPMVRLGDVCEFIRNGASIKQDNSKKGFPITRIETISNGVFDRSKMGYAGIYDLGKYEDYVLKTGDILMSHINSISHLGKTAYYENINNETIIHGMNLLCLRLKKEQVNYRYTFYYLNSPFFKRQIPRITKKSVNQASFTVTALKELQFIFPPLNIQKYIADTLDKTQEIIDGHKKTLAEFDDLIMAVFYELFGNPVTNDKGWETKLLADVAPLMESKFDTKGMDKVWLLNLDAIESNTGEVLEHKYVNPAQIGTSTIMFDETNVLYSKLRPYLNKVVIPNSKGIGTSELVPFKPKDGVINRIFLATLLRTQEFVTYISTKVAGAKMPRVIMSELVGFRTILPPLDLQNKFAEIVTKIEEQKALVKQAIAESEHLFKSLMSEYFD